MGKLLSIIVPSYNMEKYLPNGLGSLVVSDAELLQSLDVIVVNDGSKDRTSEIAHGFAAKYPGVFRVIDKANGNYGSCINAALPMAQGRFVKILDADDSYDTAAFERYLRALSALPSTTDLVLNDWVQVDETGRVTETPTCPFPTGTAFGLDEIHAFNYGVAMYAIAYRTELLREMDYVQTEGISYTDTEWACIPIVFVRTVCFIREPVYRYLRGRAGQSMENETFARNVWMLDRVLERLFQWHDMATCSSEGRAYLELRIVQNFNCSIGAHLESVFRETMKPYLEWVRQKSALYDFIADVVRNQALTLVSKRFRFHYVEFALRHPRLARPTLLAVMSYIRVRNRFRRFRRSLKQKASRLRPNNADPVHFRIISW